jgi:hypothetical protein
VSGQIIEVPEGSVFLSQTEVEQIRKALELASSRAYAGAHTQYELSLAQQRWSVFASSLALLERGEETQPRRLKCE